MNMRPLKVSEVNQYLKRTLSGDPLLSNIAIEGEISNCKYHYSGHIYFNLKDEKSKLKCIMFKNDSQNLSINLRDGMKIVAMGYISIFERDGVYQLYVKNIKEKGIGELYIEFEKLKSKLEKEGLFDEKNKKSLPFLPKKIGIVTSSTGAAIRDIITVTKRRFPIVDIFIYPVLVQGENAPPEIISGINYFNRRDDIDIIIVGRGGGSLEELFAFNDEGVARAIYDSKIPIISAIGHETDFTIADFVSDLRAPTPSAAAELAVPELLKLEEKLLQNKQRFFNGFLKNYKSKVNELESKVQQLNYNIPTNITNEYKQLLDTMVKELMIYMGNVLKNKKNIIDNLVDKINSLNPLSILELGYSAIINKDGKIIKSVNNLKVGENVKIIIRDGIVNANIEKIKKGEFKYE